MHILNLPKSRLFLWIVICPLLGIHLTGCHSQTGFLNSTSVSSPTPNTQSPTGVVPPPTAVPERTFTALTRPDTPLPAATQIPPQISSPTSASNSCPVVHDTLPDGFLAPGLIIFDQYDHRLHQFKPGMEKFADFWNPPLCPTCSPGYILEGLSNDHKWLAITRLVYQDAEHKQYTDELVVTNGDEQDIRAISDDFHTGPHILPIYGWLNNSELLFGSSNKTPEGNRIRYNPFTRQRMNIQPVLPSLLSSGLNDIGWWGASADPVVYDPTGSRAVYYYCDGWMPTYCETQAVVLWDVEKNRELWRLSDPVIGSHGTISSRPVWSPDGSQFVISAFHEQSDSSESKKYGIELVLISHNGKAIMVDRSQFPISPWDMGSFSWSPDGHYLAFSAIVEDKIHLLVLDVQSFEIWDPCITDTIGDGLIPDFHLHAMWSADSSQFLVRSDERNPQQFFLVVDVRKHEVANLGFSYNYAVWLAPYESIK